MICHLKLCENESIDQKKKIRIKQTYYPFFGNEMTIFRLDRAK